MAFEPITSEDRSDALTECTATWLSSFVQCSFFISAIAVAIQHICFKLNLTQVITLVVEWTDTYGIQQWRIFRNIFRKFAWVVFELTTTKFCSDTQSHWAMIPWAQFTVTANFVQLLQFHLLFFCSMFTFHFDHFLRQSLYI